MILLEKDKIKYYEFYEQDCLNNFIDVTSDSGLVNWLTEEVEFVADFTFHDFFKHLLREKDVLNKVFFSSLKGYKIEDYKDDIEKPKVYDKDFVLSGVQVGWRVEIRKDECDIACGFHGVGSGEYADRENAIETAYGMSMTPLSEYADKPFKLNRNFIIEDYQNKVVDKILKSKRTFTLFDVIHAVLYEITWDGNPQERDIRSKELDERIKKSEKDIAEGNCYSMEEVMERIESRLSKKNK